MKNFCFFVILIILSSCKGTNQVKEIITENNIVNPVVHRVETEQLLNVDKIGVYDTLSVFINLSDSLKLPRKPSTDVSFNHCSI